MSQVIFSPPVVVIMLVLFYAAISYGVGVHGMTGTRMPKSEPGLIAQNEEQQNISLDYSQFYPFAFFFTVMHILILVIATAPTGSLTLPLLYAAAGVLALVIIFRR